MFTRFQQIDGEIRMKFYVATILILITSISLANDEQLNRYTFFKESMIYDKNVPNELINSTILEGINNSDVRIRRLTLQALGVFAENVYFDPPLPTELQRSINEVPRLKETLLTSFRDEHMRSGYDANGQIDRDIYENWESAQLLLVDGIETVKTENAPQPDEIRELIQDRISPWLRIPLILAVLWPRDMEVHELIWEYYENDRHMRSTEMLTLLNAGQFDTKEANDLRMLELVSYLSVEETSFVDEVISLSARGLSISHPEQAIPMLIEAGLNHINPRSDILITLSGYSDEQLDPFFKELVPLALILRWTLQESEGLEAALDRLVPYAQKPHPSLPSIVLP